MTDRELQRRAEAIFLDLVELPTDRRAAELTSRCDSDPALEAEVRSLLAVHQDGGNFLSNPELLARSVLAGLPPLPDEDRLPTGTILGDYTIRSYLGAGGMGSVYIAEQQKPRRTVALKLIRHASRALLRRFEHEAEVLGRLQHPGIAQIFEAGSAPLPGGAHIPFIAMELVEGSTITEHARARNLSTEARLELLARVCDAVHHAHQRAVIHRDLKPANILVTLAGQPKVLDFGVARVLDLQLTTVQTNAGGQLIGTLPYMSPEQVSGDSRDIDTRSDVYALGVILYQLLADRLPVDVSNRSIPDAIRLIRDEPHESLSRISRIFRGEIDTIVSRALEKDKDRRYQSAAALAEDLRRYLRAEPILAKQDSAMYLLRKAIRRYRAAVAGISLAVLGLVAFSLYAWRQSHREASARADAQVNAEEAGRQRTLADNRAAALAAQLRTNTIERARLLAQNGNLRAAEDILWPLHLAQPSAHSGWALWDTYLRMPCIATLPSHRDEIFALALSDDGARFASGGEQGHCIIWNAHTFERLAAFDAHDRSILGLAFLPDGTLITTSLDGVARAWRPDGTFLRFLELPGGGILSLAAFDPSPGTRNLAAACRDGVVRVFDGTTLELLRSLTGGKPGQNRIACDARGQLIAAGSEDGTLCLWTSSAITPLYTSSLEPGSVASLAMSADGTRLATGGGPSNRWIRTWSIASDTDTRDLDLIAESRWNNGTVRSLQFSADATRLLAAGYHRFEILRTATCLPAPSPIRFSQPTMRALWLPAQGRILASDGPNIRIWQDSESRLIRRVPAHSGGVSSLLIHNSTLFSSGADGLIRAWSIDDSGALAELFRLEGHTGRIRSLDAVDNSLVSVGYDPPDSSIILWNLAERRAVHRITFPRAPFAARLSNDGSLLAATSRDRSIHIYSTRDAKPIRVLDSGQRDSGSLAFLGSSLISLHSGGNVYAWDTSTWQRTHETRISDGTWSIAALPGSTDSVILGGWTGSLTRWDLPTGTLTSIPTSHTQMVTDLCIADIPSPTTSTPNQIVLSSGSEGSVCIGDPRDALALAAIAPDDDAVLSIAHHSHFLFAALSDGSIAVIGLREGEKHMRGNQRGH